MESSESNSTKSEEVSLRNGCNMTLEDLQNIITEREAEVKRHAEEIRLDGLRRIAEMNSKDGIHPLSLFPKEIWIMILEKVSPGDRWNMYEIHPVFQDLLEEKKIGDILLPLVLDYKIPFLEKLLRNNDDGTIDIGLLMNLRLVSKKIRDSVAKWIEEDLLNSIKNSSGAPSLSLPVANINPSIVVPARQSKLNRLLSFSNGPINARPKHFPLKSLSIYFFMNNISAAAMAAEIEQDGHGGNVNILDEVERAIRGLRRWHETYRNHIMKFLKAVGDQIWYCSIVICAISNGELIELDVAPIYDLLQECLLLMPHIKCLVLDLANSNRDTTRWTKNAKAVFQVQAMRTPFMKDLERVDFFCPITFRVWDSVLAANPHVKYYNFQSYAGDDHECYAEPLVQSLSLEDVSVIKKRPWDFQLLQQVSESNWKLKKMSFGIQASNVDESLELYAIFRCLNKFQTLEDLSISIVGVTIGERVNFLRLPNLKNFELELGPVEGANWSHGMQFFYSLQFLLHCSKLESLKWMSLFYETMSIRQKFQGMGNNEDIVDFKCGFGDSSCSSLWNVFPRLKFVQVKLYEEDEGGEGRKVFRERKYVGSCRR